jgi:hypothetical protein
MAKVATYATRSEADDVNRHTRRAEMSTFRHSSLLTNCVAFTDAALSGAAGASGAFPLQLAQTFCIACKVLFVGEERVPVCAALQRRWAGRDERILYGMLADVTNKRG